MSKSLNRVQLLGRAGKDVEMKYTASGQAVASVSIATNEVWTDANGEKKESVQWTNLVMWSRLAEIAKEFVKKGSHLFVEGKLQTRQYEDKQGQTRYVTEVNVNNLILLDGKANGNGGATQQPPSDDEPPPF